MEQQGLRFEIIHPEPDEPGYGVRVWLGASLLVTGTGFSDEAGASAFATGYLVSMLERFDRLNERTARQRAHARMVLGEGGA